MKDWTGNNRKTFSILGASNHSDHERETHDYYATESKCGTELLEVYPIINNIWECACGEGHLSKTLCALKSTDLVDRGFGESGVDFLKCNDTWDGWIVTNPPYKYAQEFCEHALKLSTFGVAMFLKLTFLEGQKRRKFFDKNPPTFIYVYSQRRKCAINGNFNGTGSSTACYAWFVWDKKLKPQETIVRWI